LNLEINHRNASSKEEIIIGKITHWIGKWMKKMHYPRKKWGMKNSAIQQNILKQMWCLCVCVFVTDIRKLRPGQPLWGVGRGATTFYASSVDVWCSLGPNGVLSGPDEGA
jgi:hypothetical protein